MGTLIVTNSHISCAEKTIVDSRQVWGTRDERSGFGVLFFSSSSEGWGYETCYG